MADVQDQPPPLGADEPCCPWYDGTVVCAHCARPLVTVEALRTELADAHAVIRKFMATAEGERPCRDGRLDVDFDWSTACFDIAEAKVIARARATPEGTTTDG